MMKKLFFLFFAALLVMPVSAAVIVPKVYPCGVVTYRDGHEETYEQVELAQKWSQKIKIKIDKEEQTIPAKDISCITYWLKDFPQEKCTIYCLSVLDDRKKNGKLLCEWGVPIMGNSWGVVFRCHDIYLLNQQTGEMRMLAYADESIESLAKPHLETWQPLLLQRKDMDHAIFIDSIRCYEDRKTKETQCEFCWPRKKAKLGAEIFKDNAEISEQIIDGTLKASDLQYILDQM
ncbi:MAG: hypothetical protein KBS42_01200 [Bacteroidales bacterium]|nr:hypothetical protein [Candidatus Colicola coprequi]